MQFVDEIAETLERVTVWIGREISAARESHA